MVNDWQPVSGEGDVGDWEPAISGPSTLSDVVQSIPQNVETAIAHTLGLPGDIAKLIGKGTEYLGAHPDYSKAYGAEDVQAGMNELQGGPLYQPQTPVGQGINTGFGFVPAMLGGPEAAFAKLVTRVGVPAAAVTGIEHSSLSEGAKPWAETAMLLLSPYAANKAVGPMLNQIRRGTLARATGTLPTDIGSLVPGVGPGVQPSLKQVSAATAALKRIHDIAVDPAAKAQAAAAWREMSSRQQQLQIVNQYMGGAGRARYMTASAQRERLTKLNSAVEAGQFKGIFSPEQEAQLAKVAEGNRRMRAAESAGEFTPFHGKGLGTAAIVGYLASFAGPELKHQVLTLVPAAIAVVAKAAYPQFTKTQINKLVKMVTQGKPVPGAPSLAPKPLPPLSFPALQPALATQQFPGGQ